MQLKNSINKIKNIVEIFSSKLKKKNESLNLKMGHVKLLNQKKKEIRKKSSEESPQDVCDTTK